MIKLAQSAKLPLLMNNGSYEKRFKYAQNLNQKFFDNIDKEFKEKDISSDIFKKHLKEITNQKIKFKIEDATNQKFRGCTFLILNPTNKKLADRFSIFIPKNLFDKKISLYDADIFMHEIFHFFCGITNPKHLQRLIKIYENKSLKKTETFYRKVLYNKNGPNLEKIENQILPNYLKNLTLKEQVDFLQNSRYRLKEEQIAYKEGYKYLNKIQDNHVDLISEKLECDNGEEFQFEAKINILEKALKNILSNIRQNQKLNK